MAFCFPNLIRESRSFSRSVRVLDFVASRKMVAEFFNPSGWYVCSEGEVQSQHKGPCHPILGKFRQLEEIHFEHQVAGYSPQAPDDFES